MVIEKSVGAIVINQEGEYLLLSRVDKKGDFWEFPKGHQIDNESDIETLTRELEEECNITDSKLVKDFVKENKYISSSSGNTRIILLYLVKVKNKNIRLSTEHNKYLWLKFVDALTKLNHDTWKKMLIDAESRIAGMK